MTNQHPIHPPTELVQELWDRLRKAPDSGTDAATAWTEAVALAAQWGSDQELEACRQWLEINGAPRKLIDGLLAARRPKPPSLKEQALLKLKELQALLQFENVDSSCIRHALEALPDD